MSVVPRVDSRVDTEVGRLTCVVVHRPGEELRRLTPRNSADLLFDGIPWLDRAQEEHDAFRELLAAHGVEVLLLGDLLAEVLHLPEPRRELIAAAVTVRTAGPRLAPALTEHLAGLHPGDLARVLVAGLAVDELPRRSGLLARMAGPAEFVVSPLPNLLFTRDTAARVGGHVVLARPALAARRREASLADAVWRHAAALRDVPVLPGADGRLAGAVEGGDILLLAPGVVAVGVGSRTTPAGAELIADALFAAGEAHTVLAVPVEQRRATMHLDTVCTMVDRDSVVMYPPAAESLRAWVLTADGGIRGPERFLHAAADAMGLDRLRVVDTGSDTVTAEREQWDDGNNTLALAPGLAVAYERNTVTNARLEAAGVRVLRIAGSELGSGRGGPRCMSCPVAREPLPDRAGARAPTRG